MRHVALNSLRARRQWAMALYTAVYVAVWAAFGALALLLVRGVHAALMLDDRALLVLALIAAATWQLTRAKRRAVLACRRTVPLPPAGLRADLGCARFAVAQALRCVRSCWALMVVMAFAGHASPVWMVALTALIAAEELTVAGRRRVAASGRCSRSPRPPSRSAPDWMCRRGDRAQVRAAGTRRPAWTGTRRSPSARDTSPSPATAWRSASGGAARPRR